MTNDAQETITTTSKDVLRRIIPDFLLKQRSIVLRLGPRAGRIYASLRFLDLVESEPPISAWSRRLRVRFFLSALATLCAAPWLNST